MSWAYWQFMLSNFTPGLQGYGGVARQEFYPGSKQKWKSSCVYIDRIKSVLSVARKPDNGACCNKPHRKNVNKEQPVCQQCNLGSDDLNETAKKKKKSHWSSFRTPAGGKSPSPLAFRSKSLTLSSLVSWPTSLQCTQRTVLAGKYIPFFEADHSLSARLTDWYRHSILMACCYRWAQEGSGSSSLWRVGPSSGRSTPPPVWTTDLQSTERGVSYQQETGQQWSVAVEKPPDLYTKSPWAAGGVVVSPTQSAVWTSIPPTDDRRRPGGTEEKIDFIIMNHTTTSWVMHLFQKTQGWQNVLNAPHRRTRCTSPETEDHGRLGAEHRVLYKTFNYIQVCCTPMTLRRHTCHKGAFDKIFASNVRIHLPNHKQVEILVWFMQLLLLQNDCTFWGFNHFIHYRTFRLGDSCFSVSVVSSLMASAQYWIFFFLFIRRPRFHLETIGNEQHSNLCNTIQERWFIH